MSDPKHEACPDCGKACERVLSAPIVSVRGAEYRAAANKETRTANFARARQSNDQMRESSLKKYGHIAGHTHNCALAGCYCEAVKTEAARSGVSLESANGVRNDSNVENSERQATHRFGGLPHLVGVDKK